MSRAAVIAGSAPIARPASLAIHLTNWDRLRVIAALDTVTLHLTGTHALFGFGLPLFLMLSVALGVMKAEAPPTAAFVERRVDRIVLPWLFWCVVLTGVRIWSTMSVGESALGWVEWPMVFYGPRIHLWFLPFIVVAGLGAHALHRATRDLPPLVSALPALVLGAVLLPIPPTVGLAWPFDQWLFSVPAMFFGYALGRAISSERDLGRLRILVTAGYALFGALAGLVVLLTPHTGPFALRYVGGLGLLVVAIWIPNRTDPWSRRLTPLMLGVYVLHPAVWGVLVKPAVDAVGLGHEKWLRVAITFPLTMLLVALLRRTWVRRFL
jgi:hypothetical protein